MNKRRYDKVALEKHNAEIKRLRKELQELRRLRSEADLRIEHGIITAEHRALQNQINGVKARIARLEAMDIELIEVEAGSADTVTINNTYLVEYDEQGKITTKQLRLVQANPLIDFDSSILEISRDSIIGSAMFGKKIGQPFEVTTPNGRTTLTVLAQIQENADEPQA